MSTLRTGIVDASREGATSRSLAGRRALAGLRAVDPMGAAGLLGLLGMLGVWYIASVIASPEIVPYPQAVIGRIGDWFIEAPELSGYGLDDSGLGWNLLYTVENVFTSVFCGTTIGTMLGLASARNALFRSILNPIVSGLTSVPFLVMAPFFLVWFGVGRTSGLLLVTLYSTVLLIIFSQRAVVNLNPVYERNAATLGGKPRSVLTDILIPATMPEVLGGLRISLAGAWGLETIAELLGSNSGIGVIIRVIVAQADTVGIMACVVAISTVAVVLDGIVVLASKRAFRWRPR